MNAAEDDGRAEPNGGLVADFHVMRALFGAPTNLVPSLLEKRGYLVSDRGVAEPRMAETRRAGGTRNTPRLAVRCHESANHGKTATRSSRRRTGAREIDADKGY
jgi:hypothetical protein